MRNFKKISAIFVVIAMMLSMVSFSAFAADTEFMTFSNAASVKAEAGVPVDVYMLAGAYASLGVTIQAAANLTSSNVVVHIDGLAATIGKVNANKVTFSYVDTSNENPLVLSGTGSVKVATITVTAPATEGACDLITITDGSATPSDSALLVINVDKTKKASTTVSQPWDIKSNDAVTKTVDFGTADPGLPTEITVKNEGGSKSETREVEWDYANDYSATTFGTQTISGTIRANADKLGNIGTFEATATVTVSPITVTAADITLPATGYTVMEADFADTTAVLTAAKAQGLPVEYTVKKTVNGTEYTADIAAAWTIETKTAPYTVGTEFAIEANLTEGAVADTVFAVAAGQKLTSKITVIPAQITGSSISVKMNGYTQKPQITINLPKDAITATVAGETTTYGTVNVTLTNDATPAVTKSFTYTITKADFDANAEGASTITVTANDYLKNLGFAVGDSITVAVDIDGAAILSGENTEGGVEIPEKFEVKTVISGGGSDVGGAGSSATVVKSYAVKVAEAKNGKVAVSNESAAKGTVITVTTTPDAGYMTEKITVKDKDGIDIPVDQNAKTFTMPAKDVTVSATFVEGEEPEAPVAPADTKYTDVAADHWAFEAIEKLADAGIINGNPDGTFAPDSEITRAEFTKMIVNLFGLEVSSTETGFVDCAADDWFTPYVAAAKQAGYVNGANDAEFAPNASITREDACTILGRALNASSDKALDFADADAIAAYAAPYVAALAELGIVNGYEDGTFAPANNITRAEAAKIIAGVSVIVEIADAPADDAADAADAVVDEAGEEAPAEDAAEEVVEEAADDAAEDTTEEVVEEDIEPEK